MPSLESYTSFKVSAPVPVGSTRGLFVDLAKQMDPEKGGVRRVQTIYEHEKGELSLKEFIVRSLVRPFVLFAQEPIIQLFGVYLAFVYGVIYCMSTIHPVVANSANSPDLSPSSGLDNDPACLHGALPPAHWHRWAALHLTRESVACASSTQP